MFIKIQKDNQDSFRGIYHFGTFDFDIVYYKKIIDRTENFPFHFDFLYKFVVYTEVKPHSLKLGRQNVLF